MEITNQVREYAEKGMAEMSEKFAEKGGRLYDESFDEEGGEEEAKPAAE